MLAIFRLVAAASEFIFVFTCTLHTHLPGIWAASSWRLCVRLSVFLSRNQFCYCCEESGEGRQSKEKGEVQLICRSCSVFRWEERKGNKGMEQSRVEPLVFREMQIYWGDSKYKCVFLINFILGVVILLRLGFVQFFSHSLKRIFFGDPLYLDLICQTSLTLDFDPVFD